MTAAPRPRHSCLSVDLAASIADCERIAALEAAVRATARERTRRTSDFHGAGVEFVGPLMPIQEAWQRCAEVQRGLVAAYLQSSHDFENSEMSIS